MINNWLGIVCSIIAIISFGLLSVPIKFKCVMDSEPMLIQMFMSIPIAILCSISFVAYSDPFSWYGVIGALIWVPISCLSIFCVRLIGISIAQTLWNMTSIIVSFIVGVVIFREEFKNMYMPIIGIMFILSGMIIVSLSDITCVNEYKDLDDEELDDRDKKKPVLYVLGILLSIVMGTLNGISMIPAKLDKRFNYIASFGIAQLFISYTVILIYMMIKILSFGILRGVNRYDILKTAGSGTLCGILWSAGYYGQTIAVFSKWGLSIGFISIQSCLIISSLAGMIIFKELNTIRKKIQFFMGSLPLIVGIVILYVYKA